MESKKIIITGGSGFIGTNLVEYYQQRGWKVLNVDISPPRNNMHNVFWKFVDIQEKDALINTVREFGPSVMLHFAARTDLNEYKDINGYAANINGVRNVIETIRATPSIERVIFASSQLVCRTGYTPKNIYDYNPNTLYGQSKVIGEQIIHENNNISSIWTIVRPTSIWGPWFAVPYRNFFDVISRNMYFHPGKLRTLKQWGFVGNTIYQIDKLINTDPDEVHKKIFYLADYEPIDLRTFADEVQKATGSTQIRTIPLGILRSAAFGGDILQKMGWKTPPLTSFRFFNITTPEVQDLEPLHRIVGPLPYETTEGIKLTVEWLRKHNN